MMEMLNGRLLRDDSLGSNWYWMLEQG